jgi:hypothetical protein
MADTQEAPQTVVLDGNAQEGSLIEAQNALLKMLEPAEETPETEEEQPTEEEESQPEEEGESSEVESEESEEVDDDYEGTDNREAEGEDLYAVTVNGEEQTIPLDELLKGYSRQSDYTKKTQDVSEQRKEVEVLKSQYQSEMAQIQTERGHYVEALQSLLDGSMGTLDEFSKVDWEQLKRDDPIEFVTKKEEFREKQEKMQAVQRDQQLAQHRQTEEYKKLHKEALDGEHVALAGKLPDWDDAQKRSKIKKQVRDYALDQGFNEEEIKGLVDHRSILVLLKASRYDTMTNSDVKAKKLKNKPRVIRSGTGVRGTDEKRSQRKTKMKRLQQSGHVDDAASLLEDMFNS